MSKTLDLILGNGGGGAAADPDGGVTLPSVTVTPGKVSAATAAQGSDKGSDGGVALPGVSVTPDKTSAAQGSDGDVASGTAAAQVSELLPTNNAELYQALNKEPDEKKQENLERRERRNRLFAAIGDGISAMSNLFFTTQGAPNMYTGKNTLSERAKVRYDKMMADWKENKKTYDEGLAKARELDAKNSAENAKWRRQLGIDAQGKEKLEHQREREQLEDERYNAEQEYKQKRDEIKDEQWQQTYDEGKRRSNRDYNLRVQNSNSGGGSGKNKFYLTLGDKTDEYDNADMYEKAVQRAAKRLGINTFQTVRRTTPGDYGVGSKTTMEQRAKPISQLAGEVEEAAAKADDDNTPPSRRGKSNDNDNTPPSRRR